VCFLFSSIEFRVFEVFSFLLGKGRRKENEHARARKKEERYSHTHTRNLIDARGGDRVRAFDVRLFFSLSSLRSSSSSRGEKSFCFLSRFLKKSHLSLFLVLCDSRFSRFCCALMSICFLTLSLSLSSLSFARRRVLEFPFASLETCEIVFNSVNVDPPINPSRTTKELRLEEISSSEEEGESAAKGAKAKIHAKITAIDARSLRSAVVGLIDSIVLVVETVERCER
jgi:hypothetical protein